MGLIDTVGLLYATALAFVLVRQLIANQRALKRHEATLRRNTLILAELQETLAIQRQLAAAQHITESAISIGTEAVRQVHLSLSRIPFAVLDAIPATRDTSRIVQHAHDTIANTVYSGMRNANRIGGKALRDAIKTEDKPPHRITP